MVNVRLAQSMHDAFKIACELKGASSLMHQFIVRTIREEREREPSAFAVRQTTVKAVKKPVKLIDEKQRKTG